MKQRTLRQAVSLAGIGLHTGAPASITFRPAMPNHGIVFRRTDLEGQPTIPALVDYVVDTSRSTKLGRGDASVQTVEHSLAALVGLQLDNVLIDIDGPEVPILDGSAREFFAALQRGGYQDQDADREVFEIYRPLAYREPDRSVELTAKPGSTLNLRVEIDFDQESFAPQTVELDNIETFGESFADARTFCFLHEIEELLDSGLIQGGTLESAVVLVADEPGADRMERLRTSLNLPELHVENGALSRTPLRYPDEPARHKLLDLLGDLALAGVPFRGSIIAKRPGHKANVELARAIRGSYKTQRVTRKYMSKPVEGLVFDINAITKILPHRYPFLLIDKITEFSESSITGIKNVTVNEPFFQGHFPGNPIMPGVLQLEAMAQVGGVLLLNSVEDPSSVWVYFVAIDNARFKKPVIPGDTLTFRLEMTALKRGICKMTGKAYVDDKLVCSADLVASLVPRETAT